MIGALSTDVCRYTINFKCNIHVLHIVKFVTLHENHGLAVLQNIQFVICWNCGTACHTDTFNNSVQ